MIIINDQTFLEILTFLEAADFYGKKITTAVNALEENTEK